MEMAGVVCFTGANIITKAREIVEQIGWVYTLLSSSDMNYMQTVSLLFPSEDIYFDGLTWKSFKQ